MKKKLLQTIFHSMAYLLEWGFILFLMTVFFIGIVTIIGNFMTRTFTTVSIRGTTDIPEGIKRHSYEVCGETDCVVTHVLRQKDGCIQADTTGQSDWNDGDRMFCETVTIRPFDTVDEQ